MNPPTASRNGSGQSTKGGSSFVAGSANLITAVGDRLRWLQQGVGEVGSPHHYGVDPFAAGKMGQKLGQGVDNAGGDVRGCGQLGRPH